MNLREKLQLLAKERILKQQKSSVAQKIKVKKTPNSRVVQETIKTIKKDSTYVTENTARFLKYKRPAEATYKSQKLTELLKKFNENNVNKKPIKKMRINGANVKLVAASE